MNRREVVRLRVLVEGWGWRMEVAIEREDWSEVRVCVWERPRVGWDREGQLRSGVLGDGGLVEVDVFDSEKRRVCRSGLRGAQEPK